MTVPIDMPGHAAPAAGRVDVVDLLRGLALVLLVLEAARQYFHGALYEFDPLDPERTTAAIFATRWVTHVCAPILALLAGVSAYLRGAAGAGKADLSRYLATRGAWLVVIEISILTVVRNFALPPPVLFQALGATGCAMLALAVLLWLPRPLVLALGVAALAGHNLFDRYHWVQDGPVGAVWQLLHGYLYVQEKGQLLLVADYSLIPWVAVTLVGYGLGPLFSADPGKRDRALFWLGAAMLAAFVILRGMNLYGDPGPWRAQQDASRTVMAFLNVQKFPPSLHYFLATLGLVFVLTPLMARLRGPAAAFLRAFGAAPLFSYVAHFFVMHTLGLIALLVLGRDLAPMFDAIGKVIVPEPGLAGSGFGLPVVYLAWVAGLAVLYPISRWWAGFKRRRSGWWLAYS